MAKPSFEEVIFHGPFHKVVGYGAGSNLFVMRDRFVVVRFESGEVGDLKVELVCEPK